MQAITSKLVCDMCGDRVGVYEPVWLALDDGTHVVSAPLKLDDHRARVLGDPCVFHVDCLAPDDTPPAPSNIAP